jgi:hypothetical protein
MKKKSTTKKKVSSKKKTLPPALRAWSAKVKAGTVKRDSKGRIKK